MTLQTGESAILVIRHTIIRIIITDIDILRNIRTSPIPISQINR
jgi:hypothetical protein